jgi:hypothetical protein
MKNKNAFYVVLILLVLAGVIWYSYGFKKSAPELVGQTQNNQNKKGPPPIAEMPKFIMGNVSKVEGQNVLIKVGPEEKTITTDAKTAVISQVKDGTGWKNISATLGDVKAPLKIVVYYNQNTGSEYKADKIQILNF